MMDPILQARLLAVARRWERQRLARRLAWVWGAGAAGALFLLVLQQVGDVAPGSGFALVAGLSAFAAVVVVGRHLHHRPDLRDAVRRIEQAHPDLDGTLFTAVQIRPDERGQVNYLQARVLESARQHAAGHDWSAAVPSRQMAGWFFGQAALLLLFLLLLAGVRLPRVTDAGMVVASARDGLTVAPGDTEVERGTSLVVMARFEGEPPETVELVVRPDGGAERRVPLMRSLSDPVFGGSVPDVSGDLAYRVEYGGRQTREFRVRVFEYPRLERADADLEYPAYTGLEPRRIENTRRISAVEGTRLGWTLQLNHAVTGARLVPRDTNQPTLVLLPATNAAVAVLAPVPLMAGARYDLRLVDGAGRTNRVPAEFVVDVLTNRVPELRLARPRGDVRPSALEEVGFDGTVWDDFGVVAHGIAYSVGGGATVSIELGRDVPAREKRAFAHLLEMEDLGVEPDQLVAWHVWADDIGPDGQIRRTVGDLYFGEIRPFEEIFREAQGSDGEGEGEGEQQEGQGGPAGQLAELQKQIITATWKLQRDHGGRSRPGPGYSADLEVVRDSQAAALDQAREASEGGAGAEGRALWLAVTDAMAEARDSLEKAGKDTAELASALTSEQVAYQALLQLQAREFQITRNRSRSRSQSSQSQQRQQQIDQLDLERPEDRYETERQAQAPSDPERREELQVLNRLRELARRQEDLNRQMQEMQAALQAANDEQEREELRRRLKRLEEEQEQMLADVDELQQRLERPENQSRMERERQQLAQTREEVQRATEAASEGRVAQALASGTRAEEQLEQMRDELRQDTSGQFGEQLRQMRSEARELERRQRELAEEMQRADQQRPRGLSGEDPREALARQLAEQQARMTNLVAQATELSQGAENVEPLLSRELYDTVREVSQDDAGTVRQMRQELNERGLMTRTLNDRFFGEDVPEGLKGLDLSGEMLRLGWLPPAQQIEQQARAGIERLREGIEQAAESVLGDDTEALRLAQRELEALTAELERELAEDAGRSLAGDPRPGTPEDPNGQNGATAGRPAPEDRPAGESRAGAPGGEPSPNPQPGSPGQPGQQGQQGQQGQRGQQGQQGEGETGAPRPGSRDFNLDQLLAGEGRPESGSGAAGGGRSGGGPLLGEDFAGWSDRLRDVEEVLDFPDLRNGVAVARERARRMRQEFKREARKPDWAVVELEVVKPLVEVRQRLREELLRRTSEEALVPIDRDPVPGRYADLVRRYYEELGREETP